MAEIHAHLVDGRIEEARSLLSRVAQREPTVAHLDAQVVNVQGQTLLHVCALLGLSQVVRDAYLAGVPLEARDSEGFTALLLAARYGHVSVVQELIACGADAFATTANRSTALHYASMSGYENIVVLLMQKHHFGPVVATDEGILPIHFAAMSGHQNLVYYFIQSGVDINATTKKGSTPLHVAVLSDKPDVVALLLRFGANPAIPNINGETPYDVAQRMSKPHLAAVLRPREPIIPQVAPQASPQVASVPRQLPQPLDTNTSGNSLKDMNDLLFNPCIPQIMIHGRVVRSGNQEYRMYLQTVAGDNIPFLYASPSGSGSYDIFLNVDSNERGKLVGLIHAKTKSRTQFLGVRSKDTEDFGGLTGEQIFAYFLNHEPRDLVTVLPHAPLPVAGNTTAESSQLKSKWQGLARDVSFLRNKKPEWDPQLRGYILEFYGRVTQKSSKNIVMGFADIDSQSANQQKSLSKMPEVTLDTGRDKPALIFGRISEDTFTLDYAEPFNAFQAFAVAVSSLAMRK